MLGSRRLVDGLFNRISKAWKDSACDYVDSLQDEFKKVYAERNDLEDILVDTRDLALGKALVLENTQEALDSQAKAFERGMHRAYRDVADHIDTSTARKRIELERDLDQER